MLPTYRAVLRAGVLDWGDEPPLLPAGDILVQITVLAPSPPAGNGSAMAAALTELAAAGGLTGCDDPTAWQKETRLDRPLPGRDE